MSYLDSRDSLSQKFEIDNLRNMRTLFRFSFNLFFMVQFFNTFLQRITRHYQTLVPNVLPMKFTGAIKMQPRYYCNPVHCMKCVQIRSFFLVRIFPHSDWIRRDTKYHSVFSPNAGNYGPKKLRIWTLFTQW